MDNTYVVKRFSVKDFKNRVLLLLEDYDGEIYSYKEYRSRRLAKVAGKKLIDFLIVNYYFQPKLPVEYVLINSIVNKHV